MNTEQLKQHIEDTDDTALDLLLDAMPRGASRFVSITNNLAKYLAEVKQHYPEARFYTSGGDGFALILGDTHSGKGENPNNELMAIQAPKLRVMGGDW
ncbi:MAG TPA: hypothetical protein VGL07_17805 [Buttiauxella sp.]|jgi:hypothetical protein